jgi:hypothetical protein
MPLTSIDGSNVPEASAGLAGSEDENKFVLNMLELSVVAAAVGSADPVSAPKNEPVAVGLAASSTTDDEPKKDVLSVEVGASTEVSAADFEEGDAMYSDTYQCIECKSVT